MEAIQNIPIEFLLFGAILIGIALFHHQVMKIAISGLVVILIYKLAFTEFDFLKHVSHEGIVLLNLTGLLLGFALLAHYFEKSELPAMIPRVLPDGTLGAFTLIVLIAFISSFLDNIAAAIIGGTIALVLFDKKVHIGFMAAIVAASNAGGAGSVVGDTTTTMIWISGVGASTVLKAFVGSLPAVLTVGFFGAWMQNKYSPMKKDEEFASARLEVPKLILCVAILVGAILANVFFDMPFIGVWVAILLGIPFIKTDWTVVKDSAKGTIFLVSLVFAASLMPVEKLPEPSVLSTFSLGVISAFFDNIPLTKLAIAQGGYDWALLAFSVGFGGSMMWFGSSAGVALSNIFPEMRSFKSWITNGWFVAVAFVMGFFFQHLVFGWIPG